MKIERTKNATRNIFFGILLKIYQILGPFILRTIFIYSLGIEYLGLNSLFTSILQVLNLAELGVGSALVFSMYKPIAEDDTEKICALMNLYKKYYRIIGMVILLLGTILIPFIPRLISGNIPDDINIYILYILNLAATVMSYWLFAYKNSLLVAHQRTDIASKISFIISTVQYIIQAIFLLSFKNYYLYLLIVLFTQIVSNIVTAKKVNEMYPEYRAKGNLEKTEVKMINQRVRDLFTARLGSVIVGSVDSIVISAFLGISVLGIYNNYYYIMSSVMGFITIIFTSCTAGIGNSIVTDSIDKNYCDFKTMTFIVGWLISCSTVCFLCLYQPFMEIWVGEKYMFNMNIVIFFCIYFVVCELSMVWATYKDAAGIWHEDRFRPLIGALVNLILNIFFVGVLGIGIYGILLSTIISYVCISMPWLIVNLSRVLFKRSMGEYVAMLIKLLIVIVISGICAYLICSQVHISGFVGFCIKGGICIIVSNVILLATYRKSVEFIRTKAMTRRIFKR